MFLLDLNILGGRGCYVHVATDHRTWSGKTRLTGMEDVVARGTATPSLVIETKAGVPCWIRASAITWLNIKPAPYPTGRP